jgi:hypothetical protein
MRSLYNTGPTGPTRTVVRQPGQLTQREYEQNFLEADRLLKEQGLSGVQVLNPAEVVYNKPGYLAGEIKNPSEVEFLNEQLSPRYSEMFAQGAFDLGHDILRDGSIAAYYGLRTIPFHPAVYPIQRGIDIAEMAYINAYGKDFLGNEIDPMLANTLYGSLTALGASGTVLRGLRSNVALNSVKETMGRAFNPGGPVSRIPLGRSVLDESYTVQGLRNIQEGMAPHVASLTSGLDRAAQKIDMAQDDMFAYLTAPEGYIRGYTQTPFGRFMRNRTPATEIFPRGVDRRLQGEVRGIEDQLTKILPASPSTQNIANTLADYQGVGGGSLKEMYDVMAPLLPSIRYRGPVPRGTRQFQEGITPAGHDLQVYLPAQRQLAKEALRLSVTKPNLPFGRLGNQKAEDAIKEIIKKTPVRPATTFADRTLAIFAQKEAAFRQFLSQQGGPQTVVQSSLLRVLDTVDDPIQKNLLLDMYMSSSALGSKANLPQMFRRIGDDYAELESVGRQMPDELVSRVEGLLRNSPRLDDLGSQMGDKVRMNLGRRAFEDEQYSRLGYNNFDDIAKFLDDKTPLFSKPQFFPMTNDITRVNAMTEGANFVPVVKPGMNRTVYQPVRAGQRYAEPYTALRTSNPYNKNLLNLRDQQVRTGQTLFPGQEGALLTADELGYLLQGRAGGKLMDPSSMGQEIQLMTRGILMEYDHGRFPMIARALDSSLLDRASQAYGLNTNLGGRAIAAPVGGRYMHILDLIEARSKALAALDTQGFGSSPFLDSGEYLSTHFGVKTAKEAEALLDSRNMDLPRMSKEETEALLLELDQAIAAHADGQPWLQEAIYYMSREADALFSNRMYLDGNHGVQGLEGAEFMLNEGERMMNVMQVALRNQYPDMVSPTATGQLKTTTSEMLGLPTDATQLSGLDDFWMNFHVASGIRGLSAETKAWFRNSFDRAIARQPRTTKPVTTYRTISVEDGDALRVQAGDIIDLRAADDVGASPGISSSLDPQRSMMFGDGGEGQNILYEIQLPAGSQVYDPSQVLGIAHRKEAELILPNATQYRVQRVEPIYRQGGVDLRSGVDDLDPNGIKVIIKPITSFRDGGRYKVKKKPRSMRCKK